MIKILGLGPGSSEDLTIGSIKLLATNRPYTMCVAAQMEIIVTAINIYVAETEDQKPLTYLPENEWKKLNGSSFKSMVWLAEGSNSNGTADALETYGMGKVVNFDELTPGGFINLNRTNGTGHAVLFISYIDKHGYQIDEYNNSVAGFKYYSSQGKKSDGGFDYRLAFFGDVCPQVPDAVKRDCGVIYSDKQKLLNTGVMFMPNEWNQEKAILFQSIEKIEKDLSEDYINPKYLDQTTTDELG